MYGVHGSDAIRSFPVQIQARLPVRLAVRCFGRVADDARSLLPGSLTWRSLAGENGKMLFAQATANTRGAADLLMVPEGDWPGLSP